MKLVKSNGYRTYAGRRGAIAVLLAVSIVLTGTLLTFVLNFNLSSRPSLSLLSMYGMATAGAETTGGRSELSVSTHNSSSVLIAILRGNLPDQGALVNLFRPHLRSADYVMTHPDARNLNFASQLPGLKGVEYFSLAQIKADAASLKANGVGFISYDMENAYTAPPDLNDPVASVHNASNIVHQNGLKLMLAPSHRLTDLYASQFAPYADIYVLQYQAFELDPLQYESHLTEAANQLKAANPSIKLIAELSTAIGPFSSMQQAYSLVANKVDGVALWYGKTPDQLATAKQFLDWLRQ